MLITYTVAPTKQSPATTDDIAAPARDRRARCFLGAEMPKSVVGGAVACPAVAAHYGQSLSQQMAVCAASVCSVVDWREE